MPTLAAPTQFGSCRLETEFSTVNTDRIHAEGAAPGGGTAPAARGMRGTVSPGPVFLASTSARRRALLTEAGIEHLAIHPGIDDAPLSPGSVSAPAWACSLAYLKARSGAAQLIPGSCGIVIGADTVVVIDGTPVSQPIDRADALRMLSRLSARTHEVITGVAIVDAAGTRRELFFDRAHVTFGPIHDRIPAYVASGGWAGKAGGYNIVERLDDGWPITFRGHVSTIMGLPIPLLRDRLAAFASAPLLG